MPSLKLTSVETIMKVRLGAVALSNLIRMEKTCYRSRAAGRANIGSDDTPVYADVEGGGFGYIYGDGSLYKALSAVAGVDNIDYSDFNDPGVIFSLQTSADNARKRARILKIIGDHVATAREWVKDQKLAELATRKPTSVRKKPTRSSTAKTLLHRSRVKR